MNMKINLLGNKNKNKNKNEGHPIKLELQFGAL